MPPPLRLHYAPDNASLCVRLALLRAGVPFATVLVDRRARGQDSPAFRAINPHGLIPALETPQGPLFETGAILLWIADRHGAGLAPAPGEADRGLVLSWLFWLSNSLHPALRILFYPDRHVAGDTARLVLRTRERVGAMLHTLEDRAPDLTAWLGAPEGPSVLDCYLCPMLRWLALYPVDARGWFDLARWPRLLDVARRMDDRPETAAAARAEGLGPRPFSAPALPDPPEGSAT
ncbi:glutathione S-transferase family protein [Rubellimicrobium sp. CFH 75288]|uniref:glutathione S-transferase family protein n=1 Tax=Rubellimicrobium sp. CFH 75288 TaxID=2697034 RepID=UPI001411B61D|nr:glutathione S-transferase family protein [Rubellimicrobium sp. CFH 75288]NAZ35489.1 glutathione S-transferase [Rubellimicrobium sp. CFH 75288]